MNRLVIREFIEKITEAQGPCWDGYVRDYSVEEFEPGSCYDPKKGKSKKKKKAKKESDENTTDESLTETDESPLTYAAAATKVEDPDAETFELDGEEFPLDMDLESAKEIVDENLHKNSLQDLLFEAPKKYDHIDFKPPEGVAKAAERGLELRKKAGGKGGLDQKQAKSAGVGSGVSRASTLKNRKNISPSTARRMKSFFARHEKNKAIAKGKSAHEDKGYVAWQLWGGNAGKSWANKLVRQMDAADKKAKKK